MVRLLVAGDLHYRGTNPRARVDDFPAALTEKLREVFNLAADHGCHCVVLPGDIVDTPGITLPTLVELCLVLAESPCPVYAVPGNHDLWGGNLDTVHRTPYGALTRFGLVKDLHLRRYDINGVSLTGHGYDADTDRDLSQYAPRERRSPSIHVVHGMLLLREPTYGLTRYTLARDVAALANAPDVLIVGHEHNGFGSVQIGKTTFVNPGALCRLAATSYEITRQVKVCLLSVPSETSPGSGVADVETELIQIESAKPGAEVLSRDHLQSPGSVRTRSDDFVALLREGVRPGRFDVKQVIEEVARAQGVSQEVRDEALRRISEASEDADHASSLL